MTMPLSTTPEIQIRDAGYTTIEVSPTRTLVRIRRSDTAYRDLLAVAAAIIRDRMGVVDRAWKGNPRILAAGDKGITVVMVNRSLTRRREFLVSRDEIERHPRHKAVSELPVAVAA
ncbi:hypothetical protein IU485_27705 [Nocardia cyriacigeorgica]|uniref:hypothetical protein n=1 Tax=Nocardia cyriacigeorgica TaxID=135487 RepID=UPI001892E91B|nr:hypothetical protein [Nocardia cyriacigeorgica]MBF6085163.1 hypothetical protein [Nocardia cyriacigeorgica]